MPPKTIKTAFKKLHPLAKCPQKNDELDMGYDFFVVPDEKWWKDTINPEQGLKFVLQPGGSHLFHLGIATAIEEGYGCLLWDRSGMGGKRLIHRLAGVIDGTYRGEWMVRLINHSNQPQTFHAGDRIIQGVLTEVINGTWYETGELPESKRGEGGFGSSGD